MEEILLLKECSHFGELWAVSVWNWEGLGSFRTFSLANACKAPSLEWGELPHHLFNCERLSTLFYGFKFTIW